MLRTDTSASTLAQTCRLYRWAKMLTIGSLAELADVDVAKLVDLEIGADDRLTSEERRRLMLVVCVPDGL